jgi:hypothetical protein
MKTPFHSEKGELVFPYRPLRDIAFVWPTPPPKFIGKEQIIHLPEKYRKRRHDGICVILAVGEGFMDGKGKRHITPSELKPGVSVAVDMNVPWGMYVDGMDNKKHYVIICGTEDIRGIVEG